jgi:hypothetical protein
MAQPGPSRLMRGGMLAGERGNLGPPPVSATGEALPESMVRDETGQLQRLYHGTSRVFPDFEMAQSGSGVGGDLYGPGIYLTESPQIAGEYANQGLPTAEVLSTGKRYNDTMNALRKQGVRHNDLQEVHMRQISDPATHESGEALYEAVRFVQPPRNIRPVYADLKRPFDIDAPPPPDLLDMVQEIGADHYLKPDGSPDIPTGQELYKVLSRHFGGKDEANDWLAANGYDGITHLGGAVTGGQPHRVYIAFSPDSIYPSVNVEALRGMSTQYPPP